MPVALRRRQGTEKKQAEPPSKSRKIDPPEPIEGKNTRNRQQPNLTEKCTTAAKPLERKNQRNIAQKCQKGTNPPEESVQPSQSRITRQPVKMAEKPPHSRTTRQQKNAAEEKGLTCQKTTDVNHEEKNAQKCQKGTNPPEENVQPSQSRITRQPVKMTEKPPHSRITRQQKNASEEKGLTSQKSTDVNHEDRDNMIEKSITGDENEEVTSNFHPPTTCEKTTDVNHEDRDNMIERSLTGDENEEVTSNFHPATTCGKTTDVNHEDRDNMIERSLTGDENEEVTLNFHPTSSSTFIEEHIEKLQDPADGNQEEAIEIQQHEIRETPFFDHPFDLDVISEKLAVTPSMESLQYDFKRAQIRTVDVFKRPYKPWEILGFVDAKLTEDFIDNTFVTSHKLCIHENYPEFIKEPKYDKLNLMMYQSYVEAMESVAFVPTPSYGDGQGFTQLAVVAGKTIPRKRLIGGLKGFTAIIDSQDLKPGMGFSLFARSLIQKEERIMLGAASFLNHCCDPNSK